jgi:hypothetical protein
LRESFADHTAGNTRFGISGGIGFYAIGIGVNDDRRALGMRERVCSLIQRDAHDDQRFEQNDGTIGSDDAKRKWFGEDR